MTRDVAHLLFEACAQPDWFPASELLPEWTREKVARLLRTHPEYFWESHASHGLYRVTEFGRKETAG